MSRILAAALMLALLAVGTTAYAVNKSNTPGCKVLSVTTRTESQASFSGIQTRTVTTTRERCRGKVSTEVAYGPWSASKH